MSTQLLQTKLQIPPLNPNLVSRTALVSRLDEGIKLGHRLFLISAPAGFGKTTLLDEWFSHLSTSLPECGIAWLSLDKEDNSPVCFWTYVIAALQTVYPQLGRTALQYIRSSQDFPSTIIALNSSAEPGSRNAEWNEFILTPVINEISSLDGNIILVLDDYHSIIDPAIHESLSFLIDHMPHQLHIVVASRVDPPLPVGRLRARGQLSEMRAADLRFTSGEVKALIGRLIGYELDEKDLDALSARTEGWAAGLQMASVAIRSSFTRQAGEEPGELLENAGKVIASLTGEHQFILDYLAEEVFQSQPEPVRQFLLKTSILTRMSPSLCDALIAESGSRPPEGFGSNETLDYIQKANLFVVALDAERRWYRYHHLFGDLLQSRLRLTHPEWISGLHRRASTWFEQNGDVEAALNHALAAEDWDRSANLLENYAIEFLNRGELVRVLGWIKLLPEDIARRRPRLCISQAWAYAFANQLNEVEALLHEAEQALLEPSELSEHETHNIQASTVILRVYLAITAGNPIKAVDLAQKACELATGENPHEQSFLFWMRGYAVRMLGDVEQAKRSFEEAIRIGKSNHDLWTVMLALTDLALACRIQGKLCQAADLYREALRYAAEFGAANHGYLSRVDAALAEILREQNKLDEALQYAQRGVEKTRYWQNSNHVAWAHTYLARVLQARGDLPGAIEELKLGDEARRKSPVLRGVNSLVDSSQAQLWLALADLPSAKRWAGEIQAEIKNNPLILRPRSEFDETRLIALVRVLLAESQESALLNPGSVASELGEALDLLAGLESAARAGTRYGSLIEILILKALVIYQKSAAGDSENAKSELSGEIQAALDECLTLAEPEGFVRIFVDGGEPLRQLLTAYGRKPVGSSHKSYLAKLLAAFPGISIPGSPEAASGLVEPLSERELEVLAMIAAGLSSQDIARKLVVAPGTIKAHVANIYRKLDVHSRTQALAAAKTLHLLSE